MSKVYTIEGHLTAESNFRFILLVSHFNETVVSKLVEGALRYLKLHGFEEKQVAMVRVSGAFEMPVAAKAAIQSQNRSLRIRPLG